MISYLKIICGFIIDHKRESILTLAISVNLSRVRSSNITHFSADNREVDIINNLFEKCKNKKSHLITTKKHQEIIEKLNLSSKKKFKKRKNILYFLNNRMITKSVLRPNNYFYHRLISFDINYSFKYYFRDLNILESKYFFNFFLSRTLPFIREKQNLLKKNTVNNILKIFISFMCSRFIKKNESGFSIIKIAARRIKNISFKKSYFFLWVLKNIVISNKILYGNLAYILEQFSLTLKSEELDLPPNIQSTYDFLLLLIYHEQNAQCNSQLEGYFYKNIRNCRSINCYLLLVTTLRTSKIRFFYNYLLYKTELNNNISEKKNTIMSFDLLRNLNKDLDDCISYIIHNFDCSLLNVNQNEIKNILDNIKYPFSIRSIENGKYFYCKYYYKLLFSKFLNFKYYQLSPISIIQILFQYNEIFDLDMNSNHLKIGNDLEKHLNKFKNRLFSLFSQSTQPKNKTISLMAIFEQFHNDTQLNLSFSSIRIFLNAKRIIKSLLEFKQTETTQFDIDSLRSLILQAIVMKITIYELSSFQCLNNCSNSIFKNFASSSNT